MSSEDRRVLDRPGPAPTTTWSFGPGPDQVADLYLPARGPDRPVVLLVHGGYWRPEYDRAHLRPMAGALRDAGYPTLLTEYTRVPGHPDATIADVRAALAGLADILSTAGGVVLVGHSAGGQLALVLTVDAHPAVTGCLALAPVADLTLADALDLDGGAVRAFLGGPSSARPDLDPARLPAPAVETRVLHGDRDSLVPVSLSESYARDGRARLNVLPSCGHFEPIDPLSSAWPVVMSELAALATRSGIE